MDRGFEAAEHAHVFLGAEHERNERRTWAVVALCTVMMIAEIIGGSLFGSIALVADGLHMSTHAGALLLSAVAYRCARRYQTDARFSFGTGKFGDLAGFTSAIVLAMIAFFVAYESLTRLLHPVGIDFREALPIAVLGLAVNAASVWLLQGGHSHDHHGHAHGHDHDHHEGAGHHHEHDHADKAAGQDNNMRSALVHIMADAAISLLVIAGLLLGLVFGWTWLDPVVGLVGAVVILSWAYGLLRDTGAILLDMVPDSRLAELIRARIEDGGDRLSDLHVWRLGPGHLGAILCVTTTKSRNVPYYRALLGDLPSLSHITVEVCGPGELNRPVL